MMKIQSLRKHRKISESKDNTCVFPAGPGFRPVPVNTGIKESLFTDQAGGVALVLVIWVIVVLVAIVGEFSYSMRTEIKITRNFKEEEEAYQLALAGIQQAKAEILNAKDLSKMYVDANGVLIINPDEEAPARENSLGAGNYQYTITDENGKLNLNTATIEQLRSIFMNSGDGPAEVDTIVDSIFDWRDTDDLHMLNGAEDDYYRSLDRGYSSKDGPFDLPEELLLVKGVTPGIFYGFKTDDEGKTFDGVGKYFTAYGSGIINKWTAPKVVLEAAFGPDEASNIIAQREAGRFNVPASGSKDVSEFFSIISLGKNADGTIKRTVKTVVEKQDDTLETIYWNDNIVG
jgi:type II secretory pathway component PulK